MLEQETESLIRDLKAAEDSYGTDILALTVICGYIERLLGNVRVERHLSKHQPDINTLRSSVAEIRAAKEGLAAVQVDIHLHPFIHSHPIARAGRI